MCKESDMPTYGVREYNNTYQLCSNIIFVVLISLSARPGHGFILDVKKCPVHWNFRLKESSIFCSRNIACHHPNYLVLKYIHGCSEYLTTRHRKRIGLSLSADTWRKRGFFNWYEESVSTIRLEIGGTNRFVSGCCCTFSPLEEKKYCSGHRCKNRHVWPPLR